MRKRSYKLTIWLNDDEHDRLRYYAQRAGCNKSEYLRALIGGFIPKAAPTPDYHKLMKQLRAIGNSMNQIAARANSIGFINADDYTQNSKALWKSRLEIQGTFLPEKRYGDHQHLED